MKFLPIHVHEILQIQKIHIASIDYKLDMYPNANKNGKLSYRQCQTFKSIFFFSLLIVISCVRKNCLKIFKDVKLEFPGISL